MLYLFFTILGFALGSTLFAYWTPKIIRHIDIRELPADHNPGVANAFMYGGFFCGLLSLILELAKGFVPVFLGQRFLDTHSLLFIPVLIAPVFGHAFPFFRKEKGGKAITASFGVLLGLFPEMRPAVYLAFFFIFDYFFFKNDTLKWWMIPGTSMFLSAISIGGDLSASVIKRNFGAKDFGTIFPGHGGIMDRFDSYSFVMPTLYALISLVISLGA